MQIFNCVQGTDEWLMARLGIPTSSMFKDMMAKGQGKTRRTYMLKLAGERITGELPQGYSDAHMERGHALEPKARSLYELESGNSVTECGFILADYNAGYSPDGLVGEDGVIEVKTRLPHLMLETLLTQKVPAEHAKQIQGGLLVSERKWCDFIAYWPGLPLFIKRVYRDDEAILAIRAAIVSFNEEINGIIEKIEEL